ncbi:uncharacterized protein MAM_01510 [Metarhizium album ARSEF 1941]|uniref:Uncharacterized protein n=1 Tax=Metarhizium album (strain ARSEF 1941) TaxID=1081103 RepID=A0A0B2WWZ1_METAS|nr:uncharacterized protein MAM_01510 [Metarhizium album ARSEF 1941]KHO00732.1 hypothetical protein MAM_01510 [Metarhizium album ARSEF 1941]
MRDDPALGILFDQTMGAGWVGLQLGQHSLSESLHPPSPGSTEYASVSGCHAPSRTAADVAMDAYGHTLRIDGALCRKFAGEPARREPTQRRSDQKLNIERRRNVEALLAYITGEVAAQACKNCQKRNGPWTLCVVYEGQMCGSCSNCWFNASGSRCTFHGTLRGLRIKSCQPCLACPTLTRCDGLENNNPQPPHFASSLAVPASSTQAAHPVATTYQQLSTAAPPSTSLQPDIFQRLSADATRQFLSQTVGDIVSLTKKERYIARIESAAQELGMRLAEYDEYLQSPEAIAEQRLGQDQLSQSQAEDHSPGGPLS